MDQDPAPHDLSTWDWKQLCGAAEENTHFVFSEPQTLDNYQNKFDHRVLLGLE